jgi:hypothetical protein
MMVLAYYESLFSDQPLWKAGTFADQPMVP